MATYYIYYHSRDAMGAQAHGSVLELRFADVSQTGSYSFLLLFRSPICESLVRLLVPHAVVARCSAASTSLKYLTVLTFSSVVAGSSHTTTASGCNCTMLTCAKQHTSDSLTVVLRTKRPCSSGLAYRPHVIHSLFQTLLHRQSLCAAGAND